MSQLPNRDFTAEDVVKMSATIDNFFHELGEIFVQSVAPAPNSQAFNEEQEFPESEVLRSVYYRGIQSMESAADHLVGFADLLVPPAKTVAPFTCVRGLLESSALAAWFLDPEIDARTRVARCYAFRHEGFVQQIKYGQALNSDEVVQHARNRITSVEEEAIQLGYPRLSGKNGETKGIAQPWPGITKLIATTLKQERAYRLLSAVAHGHHWATIQTSFRIVELPNSQGSADKGTTKYVNPNFMVYFGSVAVTSLSRVEWYLWRTYGWDLDPLYELLESTYQALGYDPRLHFWREVNQSGRKGPPSC